MTNRAEVEILKKYIWLKFGTFHGRSRKFGILTTKSTYTCAALSEAPIIYEVLWLMWAVVDLSLGEVGG